MSTNIIKYASHAVTIIHDFKYFEQLKYTKNVLKYENLERARRK